MATGDSCDRPLSAQLKEQEITVTTFVPVQGLHHFAYRCKDAEETRHFYEDILGLPLTHIIRSDHVPSTGEYCPYVHLFFAMEDGSSLAFFDLGDDTAALPSPNTPAWVNHLALTVDSELTLTTAKMKLTLAGIDVLGPTDHGFVKSIYFFDPNGIRLEFTTSTAGPGFKDAALAAARTACDAWTQEKRSRRAGI